jgi:DNA-binding NarL/FixJ family response regulator
VVTGRKLVLFVVTTISSRGRRVVDGSDDERSPTGRLTPRELQVVQLIALGFNGPEVAHELQLAHDTVRTHVRNAMTKTGTRSRAQLVAKTLAEGLALGGAG